MKMNSLRKKIIPTVMLSAVFWLGVFWPVRADDKMTFTITPPLIKINMEKGGYWSSAIKLTNNNLEPIRIYVQVLDFRSGREGGIEFFKAGAPTSHALSQWIDFSTEPVDIEPFKSREIPFTIRLPETAEPGGHYAAIMAGTKPSDDVKGSAIKISSTLASLILLNVNGQVVEQGEIREFAVDKELYNRADVNFTVRFQNTGNVHIQPQGEIKIYDFFNRKKGSVTINQNSDYGHVLPESIRKWDFSWQGGAGLLNMGRYRADLVLSYGSEAKSTENRAVYFWVLDFKLLGLVGGGIFLFIFLIVYSIKAYIRRSIRAMEKQLGSRPAARFAYEPAVRVERKTAAGASHAPLDLKSGAKPAGGGDNLFFRRLSAVKLAFVLILFLAALFLVYLSFNLRSVELSQKQAVVSKLY